MNSRISIWFCFIALGLFLVPQWAWANLEMQAPTANTCSMSGNGLPNKDTTTKHSHGMENCGDCNTKSHDCNSSGCTNHCNAAVCGTLLLHGAVISKSALGSKTALVDSSSKKSQFYYLNPTYLEGLKSIWQPPKLFL
ncbi:hypothetical protein [Chryseobacterium sp. A321]